MKFDLSNVEFNEGMVIHCNTKEKINSLLDELSKREYIWGGGRKVGWLGCWAEGLGDIYIFIQNSEEVCYDYACFVEKTSYKITEFDDLRSLLIDGSKKTEKRDVMEEAKAKLREIAKMMGPCITELDDGISNDERHFSTGAVRDTAEGKGRFDLLPMFAIHELAKAMENGAKHYGERNVDKGIPQHSLIDSGMRHLTQYIRGDKDEKHLVSALWNIAWAVQQDEINQEMNDLPWADGGGNDEI